MLTSECRRVPETETEHVRCTGIVPLGTVTVVGGREVRLQERCQCRCHAPSRSGDRADRYHGAVMPRWSRSKVPAWRGVDRRLEIRCAHCGRRHVTKRGVAYGQCRKLSRMATTISGIPLV